MPRVRPPSGPEPSSSCPPEAMTGLDGPLPVEPRVYLVTDVLAGGLGFEGFVVSDPAGQPLNGGTPAARRTRSARASALRTGS